MEIGVHLPLIAFGDDALSLGRLERAAVAASKRGQRSSNGMPSAS